MARRIRTNVVNEGLKPITTKETTALQAGTNVLFVQGVQGGDGESLIVEKGPQENLDHSPEMNILASPLVETQLAPGLRQPASETKTANSNDANFPASGDPPTKQRKNLQAIQEGNRRFIEKKSGTIAGKHGAEKKSKNSLAQSRSQAHMAIANSNSLRAIVLSCSDGKVNPESIFDQDDGQLTVIRTFGASVDSAVIASLEHSVKEYGANLIIVLGHTQCSAIEAAINQDPGLSTGGTALDKAIAEIRPRVLNSKTPAQSSKTLAPEAAANVQAIAIELTKRSQILEAYVKSGSLQIIPALYILDSGHVDFYE
jgi:carbonic anhydrase